MEEQRKPLTSWTVGFAAIVALLLPAAASAVPLSPTQHFLLGDSPYLHNGSDGEVAGGHPGDGTEPMPGVNAPDVPIVDMGTWVPMDPGDDVDCTEEPNPEDCMPQWMRVMSADWQDTLLLTGLPTPGTPTPADPALVGFDLTITLDPGFEVAENAMVTEEGRLKLMLVIWDVRPTDPDDGFIAALQAPSVLGGFDKDSFSGDLTGGPVIADATDAVGSIPFPHCYEGDPDPVCDPTPAGAPGSHMVQGMGIKLALNPGEAAQILADYWAGEDLGGDLSLFADLYWYKVPEPGSALMLLMGLAGMAYMGRRTH
jgi:hypothetical protein